MGMTVDANGFRRKLARARRHVKSAIDPAEQEAAQQVRDILKRVSPVDTGKMRDTITIENANGKVWVVIPKRLFSRFYYPDRFRDFFEIQAIKARPRIEKILGRQFTRRLPDDVGE